MHAEIMAIFCGLHLCWDRGYRKVICYLYSAHVVDLVKNDVSVHHWYGNVVAAIKRMMCQDMGVCAYSYS